MARFCSLLVFFLLCVTSSSASRVVDVDNICKQTTDSSFCLTFLNSRPDAGGDLVSLAQYTIDVVRANVTNTINLIKTLIAQSGSDVKAREHYKMCLLRFGDSVGFRGAIYEVGKVQQLLKTRDYYGMATHAGEIMIYADYGFSEDYPGAPTYHDTSLLPKYAKVVYNVAEIILVIADYLV